MQSTLTDTHIFPSIRLNIQGDVYDAVLFNSPDDHLFPEVPGASIFLSRSYQQALHASPPDNMYFRYVRIDQNGKFIGMLCFHISSFNPGESLKNHMHENFFNQVRYRIASLINLKTLCLGNTLLTGDYGFCFSDEVPSKLRTLLMMRTIDWMLTLKEFKKINLVFVKDFYEDIFKELPGSSYCRKYHPIDTQPSMIMDISDQWCGVAGYMRALKSKYRVRAKKAIELASTLHRVELNADEIEEAEELLHELYLKVVEDVGFNLFVLSARYFTELKKSLGDKFHLWVYKDKGEIISFFTVFEDGYILDAHFLGYDPEVNHRYKLYLNMLLAMIDHASSKGFRQLQLSRTATEIKSSVGAEGLNMWSYLRIRNRLLNGCLPAAYSFFKPDLSWVKREPFHDNIMEKG